MTLIIHSMRPVLTLRVGITGARRLRPAEVPRLSTQLYAILATIQRHMHHIATHHNVTTAYNHATTAKSDVILRFLSPLALGADRMAAREALALGYRLHVPMPFPRDEYEKDFDTPADLAEFLSLFPEAGEDWLAIDGDHGSEKNRAYEAVGHYVVRHSDILIAIWDGGRGAGRGGTADIVRHAVSVGVPICWVHATEDRRPTWIGATHDLDVSTPNVTSLETALAAHLETLILPPRLPCRQVHGIIDRLAWLGLARHIAPMEDYFVESARRNRWAWRAHTHLTHWAAGFNSPWTPSRRPIGPVANFWFDRYKLADVCAGEFAARYRLICVCIFILGAFAISIGVLAFLSSTWRTVIPWLRGTLATLRDLSVVLAFGEFAALVLILALITLGMRGHWRERSIAYRLLAELYRKQQVLAPLGWTLPVVGIRSFVIAEPKPPDHTGWIAWLFAAEQRAAPFTRGFLANAVASTAVEELIDEQRLFHANRQKLAEVADSILRRCGVSLFVAALLGGAVKLLLANILNLPYWAALFGVVTIGLAGASAAVLGIRGCARPQRLAEQSRRLTTELERARQQVNHLKQQSPLASQDLGIEAVRAAMLMLEDLEGWARLCQMKIVERS
jgi:hypothetical protein